MKSENSDSTQERGENPEYPYPFSAKRVEAYQAELSGQPAPQTCPGCGGTGYVKLGNLPADHEDFGKIVHCSICNLDHKIAWLSKNCGLDRFEQDAARLPTWQIGDVSSLPPELQETYASQRVKGLQAIRKALQERVGMYTFYGDFGSGKTKALQIVTNEVRLQMIESFYIPFSLLLDHLRSLYGQGTDSSYFWQRLLDIPVLCLDEVTRFNETPWAREKLFNLTDTRYRRRTSCLTLFATNDDPKQVLSTNEDVGYLYSRMRQGQLIELRGDMRQAVK